MNIETILTTIDYLEKLKLQSEDDTLDKLILFWKLQANQHEAQVSPMLAEEKTKRAFTDIHQILSNSKYGMNDCVARDKIYKVLNNLQQ